MLGTWIADTHYSVRRLWAHPGYAMLAVLTLALGVGGTASTYGVARGVLFDPLPYPHAREVGVFWKKTDWTEEEFLYIRGRVPGFQQVALYRQRDLILRDGDEPAHLVPGVTASAELFDVLGVNPLFGRGFRAGDDAPGAEPSSTGVSACAEPPELTHKTTPLDTRRRLWSRCHDEHEDTPGFIVI